jgi:hypothetical protein
MKENLYMKKNSKVKFVSMKKNKKKQGNHCGSENREGIGECSKTYSTCYGDRQNKTESFQHRKNIKC